MGVQGRFELEDLQRCNGAWRLPASCSRAQRDGTVQSADQQLGARAGGARSVQYQRRFGIRQQRRIERKLFTRAAAVQTVDSRVGNLQSERILRRRRIVPGVGGVRPGKSKSAARESRYDHVRRGVSTELEFAVERPLLRIGRLLRYRHQRRDRYAQRDRYLSAMLQRIGNQQSHLFGGQPLLRGDQPRPDQWLSRQFGLAVRKPGRDQNQGRRCTVRLWPGCGSRSRQSTSDRELPRQLSACRQRVLAVPRICRHHRHFHWSILPVEDLCYAFVCDRPWHRRCPRALLRWCGRREPGDQPCEHGARRTRI